MAPLGLGDELRVAFGVAPPVLGRALPPPRRGGDRVRRRRDRSRPADCAAPRRRYSPGHGGGGCTPRRPGTTRWRRGDRTGPRSLGPVNRRAGRALARRHRGRVAEQPRRVGAGDRRHGAFDRGDIDGAGRVGRGPPAQQTRRLDQHAGVSPSGTGAQEQIVMLLQPATTLEVSSMVLAAHGLTHNTASPLSSSKGARPPRSSPRCKSRRTSCRSPCVPCSTSSGSAVTTSASPC